MNSRQTDKVLTKSTDNLLLKFKVPVVEIVESMRKMGIKEFFSLLKTNLKVTLLNLMEFFKVAFRYYSCLPFFKADLALRLMYLFNNPFSISKRFLMKKGEKDIYAYGETPLTSLEIIAKESQLTSHDCLYELGCGRGRTCFWLNCFTGCSVIGVDFVPEFIERANRIKSRLGFHNIEFRLGDFCETDFKGATVCYLYGTCLDNESIHRLIEKFSKLPAGTKIITVSFSLNDYTNKPCFEIMKRFTVPFTWGNADVFLHIIKSN